MIGVMKDVNIQLNSSRHASSKTLAPKTLLSALQDFANSGVEPEGINYFRSRCPGFLDDLVYTGYVISIGPPNADTNQMTDPTREMRPMWKQFEKYRDLVRAAWSGNEAAIQFLLRVGIEENRTENAVRPDWRRSGFRYEPRTNFQAAVYELLKHSRQARVCANPDCASPYFLTLDPRRKFCSVECAQPAQKQWRRTWWEQHGKEWRKKRAKKSTKRRKPHGNN